MADWKSAALNGKISKPKEVPRFGEKADILPGFQRGANGLVNRLDIASGISIDKHRACVLPILPKTGQSLISCLAIKLLGYTALNGRKYPAKTHGLPPPKHPHIISRRHADFQFDIQGFQRAFA